MSGPQDAINRIQAIARGLDGVKQAPDYVPESMNQFPFAITYYRQGETTAMTGWRKGLHTVHCEIHVARQILPNALKQAMPFYDAMLAGLEADPTLGGTVSTIVWPVTHTFGWMEYGGQNNLTIGWRFAVTFKQETSS